MNYLSIGLLMIHQIVSVSCKAVYLWVTVNSCIMMDWLYSFFDFLSWFAQQNLMYVSLHLNLPLNYTVCPVRQMLGKYVSISRGTATPLVLSSVWTKLLAVQPNTCTVSCHSTATLYMHNYLCCVFSCVCECLVICQSLLLRVLVTV